VRLVPLFSRCLPEPACIGPRIRVKALRQLDQDIGVDLRPGPGEWDKAKVLEKNHRFGQDFRKLKLPAGVIFDFISAVF
jgi:hypothetical protein